MKRYTVTELLAMQKNKPNSEELYWAYTEDEASIWIPFKYPINANAVTRMENEVTNIHNWGRYNSDVRLNRNYTIIRNIPPFHPVYAFSLRFPDGRIWDSNLRKFR